MPWAPRATPSPPRSTPVSGRGCSTANSTPGSISWPRCCSVLLSGPTRSIRNAGWVIEEINMNEDDPSDVAAEAFMTTIFNGHSLGLPVLGTRDSIGAMSRDDIDGYWRRRYGSGTVVVTVAGNIEHRRVVDLVEELFGSWEAGDGSHDLAPPEIGARVEVVRRDTEQIHLVYGGESIDRTDHGRLADGVMHHILGGGDVVPPVPEGPGGTWPGLRRPQFLDAVRRDRRLGCLRGHHPGNRPYGHGDPDRGVATPCFRRCNRGGDGTVPRDTCVVRWPWRWRTPTPG